MKSFFTDLKKLIFDLKFIVPLILVTFLGYGYMLMHFTIGIDDLTRPRYIGSENIAQGRFSGTIIDYMFGFTEYKPLWEDLLSVIIMIIAGILVNHLLRRITKNSFSYGVYNFFACFFVTFPLINEIFLYGGSGLNISIGYTLTFLSLIIFEHFFETKKYRLLIPCLIIWIFNISLYESFILVYSCFVCGIFFIRHMIADGYLPCTDDAIKTEFKKRQAPKKIFTEIGWYIGVLAGAIILEFIISNAVIKLSGFTSSIGEASNLITAFNLKNTLYFFFTHFLCASFKYLPITIFSVCAILGIIISVKYTIHAKHGFYILYFSGMVLSVIALSLMRSGVTLYRNIQCMVIFCGVILIIILQKALNTKIKWKKVVTICVATLLIIIQASSLVKWFRVDYLRGEEEKAVMITVGDELTENYDISSKPVLFVGEYTLTDKILDYKFIREGTMLYEAIHTIVHTAIQSEENCNIDQAAGIPAGQADYTSVISWGIYAFKEVNTELLRYFDYLGYSFIQGTPEQNIQAIEITKSITPKKSSFEILDTEEFIVVKFG